MIQIYFLSIFLNLVAGYTLISENEENTLEIGPGFSLKDEKTRLILGILCLVTGVLKLLSPIEGDIPILGDLIPGAIGFTAGLVLVFEHYRNHSSEAKETTTFSTVLMVNRKIVGFAAIAIAAVHFLLPKVLFF
jgi:hypothetical protein